MRSRSALAAIVGRSVREVWLAPALATVIGLAMVTMWTPLPDTPRAASWTPPVSPLTPLVVAGVWAGMATTGRSRTRWAYLLARPVPRARMFWVPIIVAFATLGAGALVVQVGMEFTALPPSGWPLAIMLTAIGLATVSGLWAGVVSDNDIERAGIAAGGLWATLGLPTILSNVADVPWSRVGNAMGFAGAAFVIAAVAPLLWSFTAVSGQLPSRSWHAGLRLLGRAAAVVTAQLLLLWSPALWLGSQSQHGDPLLLVGEPGQPVLTLGGAERPDGTGLRVNGVLQDGVELVNLTRVSAWQRDEMAHTIEDVYMDPTAQKIAFATRSEQTDDGRSLLVVDRETGTASWLHCAGALRDAAFSPDGSEIAVAGRDGMRIVDAADGSELVVKQDAGPIRVLGWHAGEALYEENSGRVQALGRDGSVRTVLDQGRVGPMLGPGGRLAWITPPERRTFVPTGPVDLVIDDEGRRTTLRLSESGRGGRNILNWMGTEHVAVAMWGRRGGVTIVPLDGSEPSTLQVRNAQRVYGPASGPWIVDRGSSLQLVEPDGTRGWSEHVRMTLGDARRHRLSLAWATDTVSGVRPDGTIFERPLPWMEVQR